MQFTGTSSVLLPQVSQFGFCLTGVKVSDTGVINFKFLDTGSGAFSFYFSGGLISSNAPICTYNTIESNTISGYYQSGVLSYLVNGILGQQNVSFSKLKKVTVQANSSTVIGNLSLSSSQINYSVGFSPNYQCYGNLTGTIVSDIPFPILTPNLFFFNSRQNLLGNNYTGISILTGNNYLLFPDIDPSLFEYQDNFYISLPTTFGNIGGNFTSYRSGVINQSVVLFAPSSGNIYAQTSLFDGEWSGNHFIYRDNPLTYNLGFNYSNFTYNGIPNNSTLNIKFQSLSPLNGSGYQAQYITGFNLVTGGRYSSPPTVQLSQYYFVTGLQNTLQSFLFSSGCTGALSVTFTGGTPVSDANGRLYLKPVRLSGIYNTGIANFMIASGYSGISSGLGYQSSPTFILSTGGGCYSVPDLSGYETPQFRFASGYGAVYAQAAGLAGLVLTSFDGTGYAVTGFEVTNIGFGYSNSFPPNISFQRISGDSFTGNASGNFLYKSSGTYTFDQFWKIAYNIGTGFTNLNDYTGYYSGSLNLYGNGNIGIQIGCSNLDNTAAVSGLLIMSFLAGSTTITQQQIIYQTRTFDLNTGALLPFSSPTISLVPLSDLTYILNNDPSDIQFQDIYNGGIVSNIISF